MSEKITFEISPLNLASRGSSNCLVLNPAERHVWTHTWVGSGSIPMSVFHEREMCLTAVPEAVVPDAAVAALEENEELQAMLAELCDAYLGEEFDGSNMVGKWSPSIDGEVHGRSLRERIDDHINALLVDVPCYANVAELMAEVTDTEIVKGVIAAGSIADHALEYETGDSLLVFEDGAVEAWIQERLSFEAEDVGEAADAIHTACGEELETLIAASANADLCELWGRSIILAAAALALDEGIVVELHDEAKQAGDRELAVTCAAWLPAKEMAVSAEAAGVIVRVLRARRAMEED